MKKIILLITLTMCISSFTYSQDISEARVKKTSGKLVFYHNEPKNEYKKAFTFVARTTKCLNNLGTAQECVKYAFIEAGEQEKKFDAVIITTTARDMAITFVDKTKKDNNIAIVNKLENKYLYEFCEPLNKYDIISKIKFFHVNFLNECITSDQFLNGILKKSQKKCKKKGFDGIIIGDDQFHSAIKFQ